VGWITRAGGGRTGPRRLDRSRKRSSGKRVGSDDDLEGSRRSDPFLLDDVPGREVVGRKREGDGGGFPGGEGDFGEVSEDSRLKEKGEGKGREN